MHTEVYVLPVNKTMRVNNKYTRDQKLWCLQQVAILPCHSNQTEVIILTTVCSVEAWMGPALYRPFLSVTTCSSSWVSCCRRVIVIVTPSKDGFTRPLMKCPGLQWNGGNCSGQSETRDEGSYQTKIKTVSYVQLQYRLIYLEHR